MFAVINKGEDTMVCSFEIATMLAKSRPGAKVVRAHSHHVFGGIVHVGVLAQAGQIASPWRPQPIAPESRWYRG